MQLAFSPNMPTPSSIMVADRKVGSTAASLSTSWHLRSPSPDYYEPGTFTPAAPSPSFIGSSTPTAAPDVLDARSHGESLAGHSDSGVTPLSAGHSQTLASAGHITTGKYRVGAHVVWSEFCQEKENFRFLLSDKRRILIPQLKLWESKLLQEFPAMFKPGRTYWNQDQKILVNNETGWISIIVKKKNPVVKDHPVCIKGPEGQVHLDNRGVLSNEVLNDHLLDILDNNPSLPFGKRHFKRRFRLLATSLVVKKRLDKIYMLPVPRIVRQLVTYVNSIDSNYPIARAFMAVGDEAETAKPYRRQIKFNNLNHDNFPTWRVKMQLFLEEMKLWDTSDKSEGGKPKAGRDSWREIMFNIDDSQFVHIESLEDGPQAWDALSKHHEKSGFASKLFEMRTLFQLSFDSGTMDDHCSALQSSVMKLKRLGVDLQDDIVIAILLNSLPTQFEALIYAWDAVGESLDLSDVISKLKNLKVDEKQGSAFNTEKLFCRYCKENSHNLEDCPKIKAKNQKPFQKKRFPKKGGKFFKKTNAFRSRPSTTPIHNG